MGRYMLFERKPRLLGFHTGFICCPVHPPVFLFRGYSYPATKLRNCGSKRASCRLIFCGQAGFFFATHLGDLAL
jgi:hypothetical protein